MDKDKGTSNIVANGGWVKSKTTVKNKVYGFRFFLFCEILIIPLWLFLMVVHYRSNESVFTLENTGFLVLAGLISQFYFVYKLIKTYGTKTRIETISFTSEEPNTNYDPKNLY